MLSHIQFFMASIQDIMASESTHVKLKEIKQNLRTLMNGITSKSMRDKGVQYKLNWGASVLHLREMAEGYGKDADLARLLWHENIRECKILATMIMPQHEMKHEQCESWADEMPSIEIAELCAMNVFQYADNASGLAFRWIETDDFYRRICGFHILSRLFMRGFMPDSRQTEAYLDRACQSLKDESIAVRHAANSSISHFARLGEDFAEKVEIAANSNNLELF